MFRGKIRSRIFALFLCILATTLAITMHLLPAQTKPYYEPNCYMVKSDGSMVILDSICGKANPPRDQFVSKATELHEILGDTNLFKSGNGGVLTFDEGLAAQRGISQATIKLSKELVGMTNELQSLTEQSGIKDITAFKLDMSKYPSTSNFYEGLTENNSRNKALSQSNPEITLPENDLIADADIRTKENKPRWMGNDQFCGVWWNPRPSRAKDWVRFNTSNPEQLLRSWGYKAPDRFFPSWVSSDLRNRSQRLGWTRPQTWNPSNCGLRTYRDNAVPNNGFVWEQNYDGWNPRGEPNPEVWASGPWPYGVWPAYVYWWHETR